MNRNGTACKFCSAHDEPHTVDEARGSRSYRLAYCPRCFMVVEAWERVNHCLSRVDVDVLLMPALTMLDLGEAIAPGRRSADPMDMESYQVDDGAQPESGVPISTPLKVS